MKLILPEYPIYPPDFTIIFTTFSGLEIANGYNRIVIGQRGPYIEFNNIIIENTYIPNNEKWRIYSPISYYIEYRTKDDCNIKIYHQKKLVKYADYLINQWYISPKDLTSNIYKRLIND